MRVISIVNQKGGVGKTTTAINLSAGLAYAGRTVLLIDMDSQGHAGSGIGINIHDIEKSMFDVLTAKQGNVKDIILKTYIPNLYIAPSNISLAAGAVLLSSRIGKEFTLQRAMAEIGETYEYTIIDCPPSLDTLTINSLVASQWLIIPCQMAHYCLEGIADLLDTIDLVKDNLKQINLDILGVLPTLYDRRNKTINQIVMEELNEYFGEKVFKTKIAVNIALNHAQAVGKAIFDYNPKCTGAINYKLLTEEVISHE